MLDRSQFMPIVYLKKAKFTGSYKGMRYRMEKASRPAESGGEGEEETILTVSAWPEPLSFDATPKNQILHELFSFDEMGFSSGNQWINLFYDTVRNRY